MKRTKKEYLKVYSVYVRNGHTGSFEKKGTYTKRNEANQRAQSEKMFWDEVKVVPDFIY